MVRYHVSRGDEDTNDGDSSVSYTLCSLFIYSLSFLQKPSEESLSAIFVEGVVLSVRPPAGLFCLSTHQVPVNWGEKFNAFLSVYGEPRRPGSQEVPQKAQASACLRSGMQSGRGEVVITHTPSWEYVPVKAERSARYPPKSVSPPDAYTKPHFTASLDEGGIASDGFLPMDSDQKSQRASAYRIRWMS